MIKGKNLLAMTVILSMLCPSVNVFSKVISSNNDGILRTVYCSTVSEIQNALKDAKAGDKIIIKEGSYTGPWMKGGYFYSNASGTEEHPIIIESEHSNNKSELVGLRNSGGAVFYLVGSYWRINNIKMRVGQKGIIIDQGSNNIVNNCEVSEIGQEGIHIRDGSCNNVIVDTKIRDTGKQTPGFGEGIYVGSDKGKWQEFKKECDNNIIRHCQIGPNVAAESVDIKEGTTGTIIEDCSFDGTGMTGQNYADSFLDIKGNNSVIRDNYGYRNGNTVITDAFQVHVQVEGWGQNNRFFNNHMSLDTSDCYILNNSKGTTIAFDNERYPDGNMYRGDGVLIEESPYDEYDFDKNGKIDIMDSAYICARYNLQASDTSYEEKYDLNKDGIIDIYDIVMVGRKFTEQ